MVISQATAAQWSTKVSLTQPAVRIGSESPLEGSQSEARTVAPLVTAGDRSESSGVFSQGSSDRTPVGPTSEPSAGAAFTPPLISGVRGSVGDHTYVRGVCVKTHWPLKHHSSPQGSSTLQSFPPPWRILYTGPENVTSTQSATPLPCRLFGMYLPTKTSVYCCWVAAIRETCCLLSFAKPMLVSDSIKA